MANRTTALLFFTLCVAVSGCGFQNRALPAIGGNSLMADTTSGAGKIKHVIWIVQENRSFNDIFEGFPNATTAPSGTNSLGKTVKLKPVSLTTVYDIDHGAGGMFAACRGKGNLPGTHCTNTGFNLENQEGGPANGQFAYVPHQEVKPYWDIAHEFVLADHMFASQLDESFVAHQYIIAAQAKSSVDVPYGDWGCEGGGSDVVSTITKQRTYGPTQRPCFNYTTLGDELDAKKLPWRFYTSKYSEPLGGYWSGYQAVKHIIYGPDWKNIITPQKQFLTDIEGGKLASFTWITPLCENSDHLDCGGGYGPSWVAALVNAIGESKFWDSTVVFIQWDDWGGVYDPVPPPFKDYDSLGFRVGMMVVSPYAKKDYVSHVQYETASMLHYAEDLFDLPRMTQADARATSPAGDSLDFSQKPRTFVPIKAPKTTSFFLSQALDPRIPDSDW
jgi:phospholipase C